MYSIRDLLVLRGSAHVAAYGVGLLPSLLEGAVP